MKYFYLEKDIFFNMDIAVPFEMIVNEFVSNSLKHAFPERDKAEIRIKLHRAESESEESINFIITVLDNSVGIPENIYIKH